jgi:hypothetical protein
MLGMLAIPASSRATGPSSITVRLRPVAVNARGEVLLKTWREANPEGAQAVMPVDLGWLVVSADGLWREATHRLDAEAGEAKAWFEGRLDWASPPASLAPLLARHRFVAGDAVAPGDGAGAVVWTGDRACVGARCTPSAVMQRTVGGVPAEDGAVGQADCRFYRAGVAILRNTTGGDGAQRGTAFSHPGSPIHDDPIFGPQELGFAIAEVDAVSLVPERALRADPKPE